jgi:general stress protein YciG
MWLVSNDVSWGIARREPASFYREKRDYREAGRRGGERERRFGRIFSL